MLFLLLIYVDRKWKKLLHFHKFSLDLHFAIILTRVLENRMEEKIEYKEKLEEEIQDTTRYVGLQIWHTSTRRTLEILLSQ